MAKLDGVRRVVGGAALLAWISTMGAAAPAQEPAAPPAVEIKLATDPVLSPDGSVVVFSWAGDLWSVPVGGGTATRLTTDPALDRYPQFSPDGRTLAFISERADGRQVFRMAATGGAARQITWHTEGYRLEGWYPDGSAVLATTRRDNFWRHETRFVRVDLGRRSADAMLFDAVGMYGSLSPDGAQLLFQREGSAWWRKGYRGPNAGQIWLYDLRQKRFTKVAEHLTGCRTPAWHPSGKSFYYVCGKSGTYNLHHKVLETGADTQLTHFDDDGLIQPAFAANGTMCVFRRLGDLWRLPLTGAGARPERIAVQRAGDLEVSRTQRRTLTSASQAVFSADGLDIAFIAGGDVWVMDSTLREPVQVTATPEHESDLIFTQDGDALLFVSESGGQPDIWRAERGDATRYWWRNESFTLKRLTNDGTQEGGLRLSPDGTRVGFIKGQGDFVVMQPDGSEPRTLIQGWSAPEFDWSPDGQWVCYAHSDNDFNRDIWLAPIDGSRAPFNLSRHPDNESEPRWSPDGKLIAFTGRRNDQEVDVYYVYLREKDDDQSRRDRSVEEALEKMRKGRPAKKPPAAPTPAAGDKPAAGETPVAGVPPAAGTKPDAELPAAAKPKSATPPTPALQIDFDRIHERIRRISIPDSAESGVFWSPDSKQLAFTSTVKGQRGTYAVTLPDGLQPAPVTTTVGENPVWVKSGNQIRWLVAGKPSVTAAGRTTAYGFTARQVVDVPGRYRAAFDQVWRTMRDWFYDGRHGNTNWDAIRRKYADLAAGSVDMSQFTTVVHLMLGELNGSHLGFSPAPGAPTPREAWSESTAHLGVRFDPAYTGPGLKIRDVLRDGPADRDQSRLSAGELVLRVDGVEVDPALDLTTVLNGPLPRDVALDVRGTDGTERRVTLRPITYGQARGLLYEGWVAGLRAKVDAASEGRLGYLHIRGMNWPSFLRFEAELYAVGAGKDGLIIDVRENGGGFTADHLLTVLTQPDHAITMPRGGGAGYPHDRRVYATWNKPIIVLCNQNSFSNAEIFSHAVKTLKRGKVVGVQTAGGVISTGATTIMDVGRLRLPFRAWFLLNDGEDMELNGCKPHVTIWPEPGDWPKGVDTQLDKSIEMLLADVAEWNQRPRPKLRYSSDRLAGR